VQSNYWIQEVETADGPIPSLCYGGKLASGDPKTSAGEPALEPFIRLDDGPPEQFPDRVLAFARHWGALGICAHGKPAAHDTHCQRLWMPSAPEQPRNRWEPLEAWRRYSQQLGAILLLAAKLRGGTLRLPELWEMVGSGEPSDDLVWQLSEGRVTPHHDLWGPGGGAGDLGQERKALGDALDQWLRYGGVTLYAYWPERASEPSVVLARDSLPGVLAVQLVATVRSPLGLYVCADPDCGKAFTPPANQRRRAAGRAAFCPECSRTGAAGRAYQRRRYAKLKREKGDTNGKDQRQAGE